jgi:hypothetical protein
MCEYENRPHQYTLRLKGPVQRRAGGKKGKLLKQQTWGSQRSEHACSLEEYVQQPPKVRTSCQTRVKRERFEGGAPELWNGRRDQISGNRRTGSPVKTTSGRSRRDVLFQIRSYRRSRRPPELQRKPLLGLSYARGQLSNR